MELEFRTKDGKLLFSLEGEIAAAQFDNLQKLPEFIKTTKIFSKPNGDKITRVVLQVILDCSYKLTIPSVDVVQDNLQGRLISIMFEMDKGAYIKVC